MTNTTDYNPLGYSAAELDHLYNARASVPDCLPFLEEYADYSAQARAELPASLAVPYGGHPDETLDIFPAEKAGAPVFVFIHGGYWRALSKDDSSFMAPVFHAAGATVRSEEHTSELQSLMRTSYAVFCLKKKKK